MKDEYKLVGKTQEFQVELELEVAEHLKNMSAFMKLTPSEIVNTAMKRFISSHKDFLPPSNR